MKRIKFINSIDRRQFLKLSAALAAVMSLPACGQPVLSDRWGKVLPRRRLGKTGLEPTIFTIGGGPFDANFKNMEGVIETAIQGGCRFFETARSYGKGESEKQFGQFLTPKYRDDIILMSKTRSLDGESAKQDIDASLEALKTDYIDIYLIHAITTKEDLENRLIGGVYDAFVRAKEEGKIGHIGFSGHSDPEVNNYVINKDFDDLEVMLFPVNVADPVQNSFILNTIPLAQKKDIGMIGMKVFAGGGFHGKTITWGTHRNEERPALIPDILTNKDAIHFALSMSVATITIGCNYADHVNENIACVSDYSKITDDQYKELVERVTEIAMNHTVEHYKSK
ncbi:MAG: aldo/keto reductase [Bacteroidales bacterium]